MNKGYARSRFELLDQSDIREIESVAPESTGTVPLAMAVYTSDKGPEDWRLVTSFEKFASDVGPISFVKHGQGLTTVAQELRAGGYVFCKRLVSNDATLANVTIRVRVVRSNNVCYVYYYTTSETEIKTFKDACDNVKNNYNSRDAVTPAVEAVPAEDPSPDNPEGTEAVPGSPEMFDAPLFTITANGRGVSNIYITITPMNINGKSNRNFRFSFDVYENYEKLESVIFTMNPDVVVDNVALSFNPRVKALVSQVKSYMYENALYDFINYLCGDGETNYVSINGNALTINNLVNLDFINGTDERGTTYIGGMVTMNTPTPEATDDETEVEDLHSLWEENTPSDIQNKVINIGEERNIILSNGSYGAMGTNPIENDFEYQKMVIEAFNGTYKHEGQVIVSPHDEQTMLYDPIIYDLDRYKIDFICDCGYCADAKQAITDLADFREDFVFFADMGFDISSFNDILTVAPLMPESKFISIYHNIVNVYDPYSMKEITVTLPYLMAPRVINHIKNGVGRPLAGIINNFTFNEIIEGSINFIPVAIPGLDQKQELANRNINYISIYDGTSVLDSVYVNTTTYTQLSYIQNVMLVQAIIKEIREYCPKQRYTFIDNSDLQDYLDDANRIVNNYSSLFDSIEFQYMADPNYESNNIFYAIIKCRFHNFIQEEYFKVIALA